jgi:hypothetical protein
MRQSASPRRKRWGFLLLWGDGETSRLAPRSVPTHLEFSRCCSHAGQERCFCRLSSTMMDNRLLRPYRYLLSRLDHAAHVPAVYALRRGSPHAAQDSLPVCGLGINGTGFPPAGFQF